MLNKETIVRCVYKIGGVGGDYSPQYVRMLQKAVLANTSIPIRFECLTDDLSIDFCDIVPLKENYPGWWSKIELFRPDLQVSPCVFFDLDTVIMDNIDDLLNIAHTSDFSVLKGFNQRFNPKKPKSVNFASGIMAGKFYNHANVYSKFKMRPKHYINRPQHNWMHGDQGFIAEVIGHSNAGRLQDDLPPQYIVGKKIIRQNGNRIPGGAQVIAWSGVPRLHQLPGEHIVSKLWRRYE